MASARLDALAIFNRSVFMTSRSAPPWKKRNPVSPSARTRLTPAQVEEAKARAAAAGRRYPNLVDNMAVAQKARRTKPRP